MRIFRLLFYFLKDLTNIFPLRLVFFEQLYEMFKRQQRCVCIESASIHDDDEKRRIGSGFTGERKKILLNSPNWILFFFAAAGCRYWWEKNFRVTMMILIVNILRWVKSANFRLCSSVCVWRWCKSLQTSSEAEWLLLTLCRLLQEYFFYNHRLMLQCIIVNA